MRPRTPCTAVRLTRWPSPIARAPSPLFPPQEVKAALEERYRNIATSKNEKTATGAAYLYRKLTF